MSTPTIDTHNLKIGFGKHDGSLYTRLPISYLKWLVAQGVAQDNASAIAQAELDRRGIIAEDIEISAHAIDRVSTKCLGIYQSFRDGKDEGLYTFLSRVVIKALAEGVYGDKPERVYTYGMCLVLCWETVVPTLKTVMLDERDPRKGRNAQ